MSSMLFSLGVLLIIGSTSGVFLCVRVLRDHFSLTTISCKGLIIYRFTLNVGHLSVFVTDL